MDHDERSDNKSKKITTEELPESTQAGSPPIQMIAIKDIRTHPAFENLLRIDEDEQTRLTQKMAEEGFYESEVVVLGLWPGIDDGKPVIIDGHRRWKAALANGIEEIPCVILEFPDMMAALRRAISLQMERRQSTDGTLYRLCERFDSLMGRGGDRRSVEAKSNLTRVRIDRTRSVSARRTASIIGCNYGKVDKMRKIRRDGTPEIQEAVRNDQMTINMAYRTIREMELGTERNNGTLAARVKAAKTLYTEKNFGGLKELPGDLHSHVNASLEMYLRWFHSNGQAYDRGE